MHPSYSVCNHVDYSYSTSLYLCTILLCSSCRAASTNHRYGRDRYRSSTTRPHLLTLTRRKGAECPVLSLTSHSGCYTSASLSPCQYVTPAGQREQPYVQANLTFRNRSAWRNPNQNAPIPFKKKNENAPTKVSRRSNY